MTNTTAFLTVFVVVAASTPALGQVPLPEPDVVLHGGITLAGLPVDPAQTDVVVIAVPEFGEPMDTLQHLATYTVGDNPDALTDTDGDGQVDDAAYVLRIRMEFLPMGAVQCVNAVILGDVVDLYVEDPPAAPLLMGSYTISGRGTVAMLDLPVAAGTCPGDIDGDGSVGINDFLALLGAWGPCPSPPAECPADLDGDDEVGITDFLALLGAWGPCP